jgi:hypothetical protein
MAAPTLSSGLRRIFVALVAACAFFAVFVGGALAGNGNGNGGGNGNGCNANGHAYGHDNCDAPADPPPPPPLPPAAETAPPLPTEGGDSGQPNLPAGDPTPRSDPATGDPASETTEVSPPADAPAGPAGDSSADGSAGGSSSSESPDAPAATAPGNGNGNLPPAPPDPGPQVPVAGWAPVVARPNLAVPKPAPRPTAPRERTFSSAAPEASWAQGEPEAAWADSQPNARDYGFAGTGVVITIRRRHGVFGGLSFRVSLAPGSSSLVFRAARSVVAGSGGRLYRIGTWLRSDVPGISVCLRIQEVSSADPLTAVRTSESCLAPTTKWKHFRLFRRTLARGNRLVFSIYSFGADAGDSFEVDGFAVARRVPNGWQLVDAGFGEAADPR